MERINVAYAEVVVVAQRHLRVGAGGADGGNLRGSEQVTGSDGAAGAVGADHHGHALRDQGLRGGGRLAGVGGVVRVDELHGILLAVDGDGGLQGVGILDAEDLLLAAAAVLAGSGLEHADLDDLVAGLTADITGIAAVRLFAAGDQRQRHDQRQHQCYKLLHGNSS